jgi:hypothetical protein
MNCNIGFIRQLEDEKFEKNAKKLLEHVPAASNLMDMIRKDRSDWFLNFLRFRGEIEHESYQTPKVKYVLKTNKLHPQFPQIDGMELVDFTKKVWQCLFTFIEDIQ